MICKKCNAKNNYYNKYCYNCGEPMPIEKTISKKPIALLNEQVPVLIVHRGHAIEYAQKKMAQKRMRKTIFLFVFLVLIAAIIFTIYIISKYDLDSVISLLY